MGKEEKEIPEVHAFPKVSIKSLQRLECHKKKGEWGSRLGATDFLGEGRERGEFGYPNNNFV